MIIIVIVMQHLAVTGPGRRPGGRVGMFQYAAEVEWVFVWVSDECSSLYFASSAAETDSCSVSRAELKSSIVTTSCPPQSSSLRPEKWRKKNYKGVSAID